MNALVLTTAVSLAFGLLLNEQIHAATVSVSLDTPTALTLTVVGSGLQDFSPAYDGTHWVFEEVARGTDQSTYDWFFNVRHKPDSTLLNPFVLVIPFDTVGTAFDAQFHHLGIDHVSISTLVEFNPAGPSPFFWGDFSATITAVHLEPASVPDAGSTFSLLGAGLLVLRCCCSIKSKHRSQ
jgi:hypothetical protein